MYIFNHTIRKYYFHSLYNNGLDFSIANLYPAVEFPVSAKTPMISSLIKWDHSEDWFYLSYENCSTKKSGVHDEAISLSAESCQYLEGHTIDGKRSFIFSSQNLQLCMY